MSEAKRPDTSTMAIDNFPSLKYVLELVESGSLERIAGIEEPDEPTLEWLDQVIPYFDSADEELRQLVALGEQYKVELESLEEEGEPTESSEREA